MSKTKPSAPRRRLLASGLACGLVRLLARGLGAAVLPLSLSVPLSLALPSAAHAQADTYPNKQIRFIVSFPAGSATDQVARLVAPQITKQTGQTVIVDNRGGASGFIAAEAVAKAPPDGYTVLITTGTTHAANPALFKKLPYDPVKDFVPVAALSDNGFILVVPPSFPANTVQEMAALAKANAGKYSFASANAPSRIGGEMFKMMAGVNLLHVPYKGAPQALTDVLGGQVSMMWTDLRTGMPQVQGGKLKALAVTTRTRLKLTPQIPTMIDAGYPDYVLTNWVGAYLPAGTPAPIAARLNTLLQIAVKAETAAYEATGSEVMLVGLDDFAKLQARDTAMWARVTKAAGMEPE